MAENIEDLLVGLQLDTDKQSFQQGISAFGAVRSAAMGMAAVVGGVSLDSLTRGFADSRRELGDFADMMELTAQQVDGLEFAFRQVGGQASEARSLIETVTGLRDSLIRGDGSDFNALAALGLDPRTIVDAEDSLGAIMNVMRDIQGLSEQRQRLILAELGAGSGEAFRLFQGGPSQLQGFMDFAAEMRPITEGQIDASREFTESVNEFSKAVSGLTDELSEAILPQMTSFVDRLTGLFTEEGRASEAAEARDMIGDMSRIISGEDAREGAGVLGQAADLIRVFSGIEREGGSSQLDLSGPAALMRALRNNGLTEEEMNATPSAGDLIPPSEAPAMPSRGELDGDAMERLNRIRQRQERGEFTPQDREYLREQMRQQFPERYQGSVTINIEGAGDPRAVAMEVDRRLTEHAGRASDAFRSSVV